MVKDGHKLFLHWAKFEKIHVPGVDLGYGGTVCQKIRDGRGEILPGPPKGSGPKKVFIDLVAMEVGKFLLTVGKRDREYAKMAYLVEGYSVKEKVQMLHTSSREYYRILHNLQFKLVCYLPNQHIQG